jgi:hypothetical protein
MRAGIATLLCACWGFTAPGAQAAETGSQAFAVSGEHAFVVPAAVTAVQVTLVGGNGAAGGEGKSGFHAPGGVGASAVATLAVSPGVTLFAEVAANGLTSGIGGYGGGGSGSHTGESGGGGGGASDVRTCSTTATPSSCTNGSSLASRLLVAAGGGGGGRGGGDTGDSAVIKAGAGGGAGSDGSAGAADSKGDNGGDGGLEGEQNAPGAAGENSAEPGTAGMLGAGGSGGNSFAAVGGGGGGGIFGGGGGGGGLTSVEMSNIFNSAGGGGGGGSSGVPSGATGVSNVTTGPGSQPSVTFTWTLPPPAAVTDPAQAVTSVSATLTGTVNPDGSQVTGCDFTIAPAPAGGASIPCQQQVGAGSVPVAVSGAIAGLAPATTYTVTLAASSAQGSANGSPVAFVTSASGSGGATAASNTGATAALTVTNLKLSPTRFRRGTHSATIAKRKAKTLPTATMIAFVLSQAATVKLSFEADRAGVLVAHKCTTIGKTHRHGKPCTRYAPIARGVSRSAHAGTDRITFDGVLDGGSRLAPRSYRLSLSAVGVGGSATAAQRPTFTLVGP